MWFRWFRCAGLGWAGLFGVVFIAKISPSEKNRSNCYIPRGVSIEFVVRSLPSSKSEVEGIGVLDRIYKQ